MPSLTVQGEEFGRLAGDAIETILKKATTRAELKRLMAAFQIFMEATIALKKREGGPAAAWAFNQAARATTLGRRSVLFTDQSNPCSQPRF